MFERLCQSLTVFLYLSLLRSRLSDWEELRVKNGFEAIKCGFWLGWEVIKTQGWKQQGAIPLVSLVINPL
jgi:hypothetical protein